MTTASVLGWFWKLIVCALSFVGGMLLGGMITGLIGLQSPTLPVEVDANAAMTVIFVTSPLFVLALYLVGRKLAGGWLVRTVILSLLAWIAFVLNNVIEAVIFTNFATAPLFTVVSFTPAVLLCAAAIAWLFQPRSSEEALARIINEYFRQRTAADWLWRMLMAAVIFMPVYYLFGLLVVPFVGDYYQQGAFGLAAPALTTLLLVLLGRSVLFLVASLPVVMAWRGSRRSLWLSLGFAHFVLVGLLYMLAGNWIAPSVRLIHTLEILADSFVYAGVIVWLLAGMTQPAVRSTKMENIAVAAGRT
ncbi:MAG: hypothetical protein KJZ93_18350 [Caldilineaceae bacterium]|nr:hypothetical protein [Caldilineaceae bacterium]